MRAMLLSVIVVVLGATPAITAAETSAVADTLVSFSIPDQFDRQHTDAEFAGRAAVILWTDRGGKDHVRRWVRVLGRTLKDEIMACRVEMRTVAHVEGVPGFVRGQIKSKFPQEPRLWALMDWDGIFAAHYAPTDGHVCPLVFGADGRLLYRAAVTGLEQDVVDGVLAAVREGATARATPSQ